jgi:hypothetical protein
MKGLFFRSNTDGYKPLKEFSHEELLHVLENNENHEALTLAAICSEILRRQLSGSDIFGYNAENDWPGKEGVK